MANKSLLLVGYGFPVAYIPNNLRELKEKATHYLFSLNFKSLQINVIIKYLNVLNETFIVILLYYLRIYVHIPSKILPLNKNNQFEFLHTYILYK